MTKCVIRILFLFCHTDVIQKSCIANDIARHALEGNLQSRLHVLVAPLQHILHEQSGST